MRKPKSAQANATVVLEIDPDKVEANPRARTIMGKIFQLTTLLFALSTNFAQAFSHSVVCVDTVVFHSAFLLINLQPGTIASGHADQLDVLYGERSMSRYNHVQKLVGALLNKVRVARFGILSLEFFFLSRHTRVAAVKLRVVRSQTLCCVSTTVR